MNMLLPLSQMEIEYRARIERILKGAKPCPDLMLEISMELYNVLKADGIINSARGTEDALLFQYGIYDWGNEHGKHFSLDITRQFFKPKEHEPYQLSFTLIYSADNFSEIDYYFDHWSMDSPNLDHFQAIIKTTKGFKTAKKFKPKAYTLKFSQV
jgi:hypothetical protein